MIEYTLLNVLVLELKIYSGPDKFYERSKFGQYDEVNNRAPLYGMLSNWLYEKRLLLRCIHHFKSDLINKMDHMRISGTEPSSVILNQKKVIQKVEKWCPKSVKSSLSQMGWCNKPTKLQFHSILTRKILRFSNATNQPKSTVELGYMCPRGLLGPQAVTLTKLLKYEKRLLLRCIHHFKSDLINKMDHMRISGTEPSSVILNQKSNSKGWKVIPQKCQIKLKPNGMV